MLPELGNFALILALCLALTLSVAPLVGAWRNNTALMSLARPLAFGQFAFVLFAYIALTISFINNDFTVLYVAENSNRLLPLIYRICAVWGAHEGSMLLWVTVLCVWMASVAMFSKTLPQVIVARVS